MRISPKRVAGVLATAATALIGAGGDRPQAGQARGSLAVTVQVIAACGGSVGPSGTVSTESGCAPASAPFAVTTERAGTPSAPLAGAAPPDVGLEDGVEIRYVTLFY